VPDEAMIATFISTDLNLGHCSSLAPEAQQLVEKKPQDFSGLNNIDYQKT